jgi:hypothetical protein
MGVVRQPSHVWRPWINTRGGGGGGEGVSIFVELRVDVVAVDVVDVDAAAALWVAAAALRAIFLETRWACPDREIAEVAKTAATDSTRPVMGTCT